VEGQLIEIPQNANKAGMLMTVRPKNGVAAEMTNRPRPVKAIINLVCRSTTFPMPFAAK